MSTDLWTVPVGPRRRRGMLEFCQIFVPIKAVASMFTSSALWRFLVPGYLFSIAVETPVLLVGLSRRHGLLARLAAGVWLTACTYPIVVLVFPDLIGARFGYTTYMVVSEVFAPVAECMLFWLALGCREDRFRASMYQDLAAVVLANLASFLLGLWFFPGGNG